MTTTSWNSDRLRAAINKSGGIFLLQAMQYHMHGLVYSNDWFVYEDSGQITFDFGSIGNTLARLVVGAPISELRLSGKNKPEDRQTQRVCHVRRPLGSPWWCLHVAKQWNISRRPRPGQSHVAKIITELALFSTPAQI